MLVIIRTPHLTLVMSLMFRLLQRPFLAINKLVINVVTLRFFNSFRVQKGYICTLAQMQLNWPPMPRKFGSL